MPSWLEHIVLSPWFILAAFAVGIAGILATFITYWRSRPRRDLSWTTNSKCLIDHRGNPHTKLVVAYDGKNITTFTITKIAIWNRGTESLRHTDVADGNPVRLTLSEGQILEASVIKASSASNNFTLERMDDKTLAIRFDYIDPGEGLVAEVRHTAPSGNAIDVLGKLIGVRQISRRREIDPMVIMELYPLSFRARLSRRVSRWPLLFAIVVTAALFSSAARTLIAAGTLQSALGVLLAVSMVITLIPFAWMTYKLFRPSLPSELVDAYFEKES